MHLILRVDTGPKIGAGHLMRCLSLAQEWRADGGEVLFLTACDNDNLKARLADEKFAVMAVAGVHPDPRDRDMTARAVAQYPGAWLVLDGYHFDRAYQEALQAVSGNLLVFDDDARHDSYRAAGVLNQNIYADRLKYVCEPGTQLLLGTSYALLRDEFLAYKIPSRIFAGPAQRILVVCGDSDHGNETAKVLSALQQLSLEGIEVIAVAGAQNPHAEALRAIVAAAKIPMKLVCNARNMPELMAWADIAVAAGGSICWELAYMGLPSLLLITAPNQVMAVEELAARGIARSAGWVSKISAGELAQQIATLAADQTARMRMSTAGCSLVDGLGRRRVIDGMLKRDAVQPTRRVADGLWT